ncbi:translocation/assembly module TamB domain-containing protein [Rhodanobacter koreensis]
MRSTSSHLLLCCCLLLGIGWAAPARADVLLTAKAISVPGAHLQQVTARIGEDAVGGMHLQLSAAMADVPAMGWQRLGLMLDGSLQRDERMRWIFDGKVRLAGAPGGALSDAHVNIQLSESANTLLVDILQGSTQANTALPLDQLSHAQISLKNLPSGWLQGLLGTVWKGRPTGGKLDAELALDMRDVGLQSSGQFTLNGIGFDTPTGTLAGQGVSGNGRFSLDTSNGPASIDLDASLHGGELLLGPLYAKLPEHAVQLGLHANAQGGAFEVPRLRVSDADALQLDGALAFDAKGGLKTLRLDHLHASFPAAYQRYGQAWLNTLGLRNMNIIGQLSASVDLHADGLHSFAFDTDGLNLADANGSLAIDDLRGGLDWAAQGERPATTLGWRGLQFYRIANGAAQSQWQSRGGALSLRQPLEVPVLKGRLRVGELDWRPAAAKGQRLETSLVLTGVDMAAFSRAMGWPAFPGTLGGAIPSLRWVDDRFELQGGLSATLFGGFVDITQLSLQQPFGASPVLSGDIALSQLDLGAITSVFDFGSITGRMHGTIDDLRLVNWNPVAFKASLLADGGGRISQRAVNNLTTVGGGGMAAGLQGAMLKLFKTFGYSRIGLNCSLQGTVCQMGGLGAAGDGYTIVEGSGLPHLQVIGHQTQVDWPTLVRRLREAINGTAPEVR